MRRFFTLITALAVFSMSFAASTPESKPPALRADQIFIPIGKTGTKISLQELSTIELKTLEAQRGIKMKFFDRLAFKAAQKKLRNSINPDGTINNKKLTKKISKAKGGETGFHVGGFALGFLLGLIGVLIAYLINDDYKGNRVKWAWIGFGVVVVVALLSLI